MSLMIQVEMETITCCHEGCGITFAVPSTWMSKRRKDHVTWCCPNGHRQNFPGKTEEERLREELARERASHDQTKASREAAWRSQTATKGALTRAKNRIHRGVCLHCNRSFSNLAAHMKTKHEKEIAK